MPQLEEGSRRGLARNRVSELCCKDKFCVFAGNRDGDRSALGVGQVAGMMEAPEKR